MFRSVVSRSAFKMVLRFCIFPLLICSVPAAAQNCSPDNIDLESQAAIDDFQLAHGPCTVVVGRLRVDGSDITSFAGLSSLESVGDLFELHDLAATASLDLPMLSSVGGSLWGLSSAGVTSINLPMLTTVGSLLISRYDNLTEVNVPSLGSAQFTVSFSENPLLESIELPSLVSVGEALSASSNSALNNLFVPVLESVGSGPSVGNVLVVQSNPSLASLSFPSLVSASSLSVQLNASLSEVSTPLLSEVLGFHFGSNPSLESLTVPVSELERLSISSNPALTNLDLSAVLSVGTAVVFNNPNLSELELALLQTVATHFSVRFNGIESLKAPALTTTGANLTLEGNTALSELYLPVLSEVGGFLILRDSSALGSLDLPGLTEVMVDLEVIGNENLNEASFPALEFIGRDLVMRENPTLGVCCGILPALQPGVVQGSILLLDNAPSCNSIGAIEESCEAAIVEIPVASSVGMSLLALMICLMGLIRLRRSNFGADN